MLKPLLVSAAVIATYAAAPSFAHPQHGALLEKADANGDGMIVREEFLSARGEMFAKLDQNGDGVLDAADHAEGDDRRAHRVQRLQARIDADGDGKVTKEEFVNGGAPMFDKLDADHNSTLDQEEIASAKERGAQWRRQHREREKKQD